MTVQGNNNIIIRDVKDATITVEFNGAISEITKSLKELMGHIHKVKASAVEKDREIFTLQDLNESNELIFELITGSKALNDHLTSELLPQLAKYNKSINQFLVSELKSFVNIDSWIRDKRYKQKAQGYIAKSFIWTISEELRRLFSINGLKLKHDFGKTKENHISDYISQGLIICKHTLQMIDFILIVGLWDFKNTSTRGLDLSQNEQIANFFNTKTELQIDDYWQLFFTLLNIYRDQSDVLTLPISELNGFKALDKIQNACMTLHQLGQRYYASMDSYFNFNYGKLINDAFEMEHHLSTVLCNFAFFANYKLISLKKTEYEQLRNGKPRFLKEYSVLGFNEGNNAKEDYQRFMVYGAKALDTYAVFIKNNDCLINLFPFVIDYHTLINEPTPKILLYQNRREDNGLDYYNLEHMLVETIYYKQFLENQDQDLELGEGGQKDLKLDLLVLQFKSAYSVLMGENLHFTPLRKDVGFL